MTKQQQHDLIKLLAQWGCAMNENPHEVLDITSGTAKSATLDAMNNITSLDLAHVFIALANMMSLLTMSKPTDENGFRTAPKSARAYQDILLTGATLSVEALKKTGQFGSSTPLDYILTLLSVTVEEPSYQHESIEALQRANMSADKQMSAALEAFQDNVNLPVN